MDALGVLAIRRDVIDEGRWFITTPWELGTSLQDKERLIAELGVRTNSVFLVALVGRTLVGFLTVRGGSLSRMRHVGKLEIMVAKAHRGKGVGKALMTACMEWAVQAGLVKLALAVYADNERAIAMYHGFGFEEEGRRLREYLMADGSYRDDLLLYRWVSPSDHSASRR